MFLVFHYLFNGIGNPGKLFQFLVEFVLQVNSQLTSTAADNGEGLLDITRVFYELLDVTGAYVGAKALGPCFDI